MHDGHMEPVCGCHRHNGAAGHKAGHHPARQSGEGTATTNRYVTHTPENDGHDETGYHTSQMKQ